MLPGPIFIKKCSACAGLIMQDTIASGNTFDAISWTDGKMDAPMLPDQPWLVICPHCRGPLWIDELEKISEVPWEPKGRRRIASRGNLKDAAPYKVPTLSRYFAILKKSVEDHEKGKYLRQRAWWAGNDVRRNKKKAIKLLAAEVSNLTALVEMLDESNLGERVMKAEALRELGRFEDAGKLLRGLTGTGVSKSAAFIKKLIAKRDRYVRLMDFR